MGLSLFFISASHSGELWSPCQRSLAEHKYVSFISQILILFMHVANRAVF